MRCIFVQNTFQVSLLLTFLSGMVLGNMSEVPQAMAQNQPMTEADAASAPFLPVLKQMEQEEKAGNWNALLEHCTPRGRGSLIHLFFYPLLLDAYAQPGGDPEDGKASRELIEQFGLHHWRRLLGADPEEFLRGLADHLGENTPKFLAEAAAVIGEGLAELLLDEEATFKVLEDVGLWELPDFRFRFLKVDGKWRFDGEVAIEAE